ncbi:CLUMA_CG019980, isoform A [Clunio marinus]|uniref:CLUMA_CG019980, isoform A n=1 Tax=Clunio marinus TaxID=568069 RepID=A0A1J1J4Z7_9DIPT|nr:CLUMA_CG019980, isoform A [Clunio marinus]
MMSSTSSTCMDGYGNFMMHQHQVPLNFFNHNNQQIYQNGNTFSNANEWTGVPLVKSSLDSTRRKKVQSSRSNGYEYDENSMSRLAKHTQGAPIIMASRYQNKSLKLVQPFSHESGDTRNNNINGCSKAPLVDDAHNYDEAGYHANGTCLPRIIKPRKRRKKDRKPIASTSIENNPPNPFAFSSNQSNGFMQNMSATSNNNAYQTQSANDNFKKPAPPTNENNLFFNCDFDPSTFLPLPSSTSSSPISLSNSSLSSSTTASSCSCRLCDPNCKIWAFPLRRSFSDNSAVELDHHNNSNFDTVHIETNKKDVGVIGGNRVKTEWNSRGGSTFSILDMIEFNNHQHQKSLVMEVNRLRSESSSDSGDSGCDLLLGGLTISDNILTSTLKTFGDNLTSEKLNAITQRLSDFSLMSTPRATDLISSIDMINNTNDSHLNANELAAENRSQLDNLLSFQSNHNSNNNGIKMCEFSDHHRGSDLDTVPVLDNSGTCNYGNLMSPMLVNKQNFSSNLDMNNNNHHDLNSIVDGGHESLKERTFFDRLDMTWKGS